MKNRVTILSLDISTKTGWSFGQIENKKYTLIEGDTLAKRDLPHEDYPANYVEWARACFEDIKILLVKYKPDEIVIEETSKGSKNNFSQKILEFIHCFIAIYIMENKLKVFYFRSEEWRRICGCLMTKDEKTQNKNVRDQHKKGTKVAKNKEGKRIGKIGKKHINVRRANELFDLTLQLKDEDRADAILMGYAHFLSKYMV